MRIAFLSLGARLIKTSLLNWRATRQAHSPGEGLCVSCRVLACCCALYPFETNSHLHSIVMQPKKDTEYLSMEAKNSFWMNLLLHQSGSKLIVFI